jgi:ferredoxin
MGKDAVGQVADSSCIGPAMCEQIAASFNIDQIDGRASTDADDNSEETAHNPVIGPRLVAA